MRIPSGRRAVAIMVVLAGMASPLSCKKAGTSPNALSPALAPGASNGDRLLATVVLPSLARTYSTADALREKNALAFGSDELRAMLKARLRVPQEVLDQIDENRPVAFALVARPDDPDNDRPYLAGALEIKASAGLAEAARILGNVVNRQKDAHEIRTSDGSSVWVVTTGTEMTFARALEDLAEAGAHALKARPQSTSAHVLLRAFPPAFARGSGGDRAAFRQQIKEKWLADYDQQYRERGKTPPRTERASMAVAMDHLLDPAAETQQADLEVTATLERGLGFSLTAVPLAGSGFARRLATPQPFRERPLPLAQAGTTLGMAAGPNPRIIELWEKSLDAQASAGVPGAAEMSPALRRLLDQLDGSVVNRVSADTRPATVEWALGMGQNARPDEVLSALEGLASHPQLPALLGALWGLEGATVKARREGQLLRLETTLPGTDRPGTPGAILRALFGGDRVDLAAKVIGDHLLVATDPGAEARLSTLAAGGGASGAPRPALAEALAEARGREIVGFLDAWGFARPLLSAFLPPAQAQLASGLFMLPGLGNMTLPIWLHTGAGETFTAELRVPIATMTNVNTLFSMLGRAGPSLGVSPPLGASP